MRVKLRQARPVGLLNPVGLSTSISHEFSSAYGDAVEFHCRVVTFGVVSLTLPSVSVKLTGMWVSSTFLSDVSRVLILWLKYPYQLPPTS